MRHSARFDPYLAASTQQTRQQVSDARPEVGGRRCDADEVAVEPTARGTRRTPADKYDERRTQLAISALATLGELGYARTSLREIAQNSAFSHGVVHYYFADKFELITHCVRYYKAQCVTRYDGLVAESATAPDASMNAHW